VHVLGGIISVITLHRSALIAFKERRRRGQTRLGSGRKLRAKDVRSRPYQHTPQNAAGSDASYPAASDQAKALGRRHRRVWAFSPSPLPSDRVPFQGAAGMQMVSH